MLMGVPDADSWGSLEVQNKNNFFAQLEWLELWYWFDNALCNVEHRRLSLGSNGKVALWDRKVTSSSHGNNLFAKSRGKTVYDNDPLPSLTKWGAL